MSYLRPLCPEDFGARGDGVTNDAAAFIAMFAALAASLIVGHSQVVEIGQKDYLVNPGATIAIPGGATVRGGGNRSRVLTTANLSLFTIVGDNVYFGKLKIQGNGVGGAQDAIDVGPFPAGPGFENTIIDQVSILSMGQAGIFLPGGGDAFQHGPLIVGCTVNDCAFAGIWNFFEYSRVIGCSLKGNGIGIRVQGGNEIISSCTIANGTIGVQIVGGGNDGHGVVSACEINHNTTNIHSFNVLANGMPIIGCNIYGANTAINLISSRGMRFESCAIDQADYFFDGSQETVFQDCLFPCVEPNTVHNNFNANASHTVWGPGNTTLLSAGEQTAFAFAADASQNLTFSQCVRKILVIAAGTLTANTRTLTSVLDPSVGQQALVRNNNAFAVTFRWSSGAGILVPPQSSMLIGGDGVNAILLQENVQDFVYASVLDASTIANGTDLQLNAATTGNLVVAGNLITLLAGRTYELVCDLRGTDLAVATTCEFGWVTAANVELVANQGRGVLSNLVAVLTADTFGVARIIFTPAVQTQVKVRGLAGAAVATLAQRFCRVRVIDIGP